MAARLSGLASFATATILILAAHQAAAQAPPTGQQEPAATVKMSCRGQALDAAGKPIAGATVFLVSTNQVDKPLGNRTTDADGKYEFREVEIPIPPRREGAAEEDYSAATFQVFGKASGHGLAWRGMKWLYIGRSYFGPDGELLPQNHENGFPLGRDIELNLTFPAAYGIAGRFVDEAGKPVAGVKIRLGNCDYLDPAGKESHRNFREFWALHLAADLMPDAVTAKTDAEGRFNLAAAPPETVCWLLIEHPDFAKISLYTATTAAPPTDHDKHPVHKLPLEISLRAAKSIPLSVVWADTGKPAAGVRVHASQMRASGSASYGTTDAAGKFVLKLPSGTYKLTGDPPRDSDYVRTTVELKVKEAPAEQPASLAVDRGAVLLFKATDFDTGAPIARVSFWYEPEDRPGSRFGVQPNPSIVTHPKTNEKGEMRVVAAPGTRKYGVGFNPLPAGYEPSVATDSTPGRELVLSAGEERVVEFLLRKREK